MNWIDFFFGWLIKGQYEVSALDGLMCFIELIVVMFIYVFIKDLKSKKKKKNK